MVLCHFKIKPNRIDSFCFQIQMCWLKARFYTNPNLSSFHSHEKQILCLSFLVDHFYFSCFSHFLCSTKYLVFSPLCLILETQEKIISVFTWLSIHERHCTRYIAGYAPIGDAPAQLFGKLNLKTFDFSVDSRSMLPMLPTSLFITKFEYTILQRRCLIL